MLVSIFSKDQLSSLRKQNVFSTWSIEANNYFFPNWLNRIFFRSKFRKFLVAHPNSGLNSEGSFTLIDPGLQHKKFTREKRGSPNFAWQKTVEKSLIGRTPPVGIEPTTQDLESCALPPELWRKLLLEPKSCFFLSFWQNPSKLLFSLVSNFFHNPLNSHKKKKFLKSRKEVS